MMLRSASLITLIVLTFGFSSASTVAQGAEPLLQAGDRLGLVGGTFIERMQAYPWLETELQIRQPDWQLKVRNLGWSGDDTYGFARKVFDPNPENGFKRLQHDLDLANPTVVLIAYGFAEASNGAAAVEKFEPGLVRLVESMLQRQRRVILMRPFALPGVRTPDYANWIRGCSDAVDRVAARFDIPAIGVSCDQFLDDGLSPNEVGYRRIATQLARALVGGPEELKAATLESDAFHELGGLVLRKDELFFHRHRPQNETYLMLFRKHEQGNNMVELPEFDALVDQYESQIWRLANSLGG